MRTMAPVAASERSRAARGHDPLCYTTSAMGGPLKVEALGHVSLFVKDLEASIRFYRDVLGLKDVGRGKNGRIAVFSAGRPPPPRPGGGGRGGRRAGTAGGRGGTLPHRLPGRHHARGARRGPPLGRGPRAPGLPRKKTGARRGGLDPPA